MMVDRNNRLLLFWPVILANTWESCLTHYRIADNCQAKDGLCPAWTDHGVILMKPDDFGPEAVRLLDAEIARLPKDTAAAYDKKLTLLRRRLTDKLYQRLGWQPGCKQHPDTGQGRGRLQRKR